MLKLSQNDGCNQVAADNEENIDAYEAAAKRLKASVEQYDGQHSQRPKSVYLSSVVHSVLLAVSRWLYLLANLRLLGTMMVVLVIISVH